MWYWARAFGAFRGNRPPQRVSEGVKELMEHNLPQSSNTKHYTKGTLASHNRDGTCSHNMLLFLSPAGAVQSCPLAVVLLVHVVPSLQSCSHTLTVTLTCTLVKGISAHPITKST